MDDSRNNIYARWISGDISPQEIEELKDSGELSDLESIIAGADELTLPELDLEGVYTRVKEQSKAKTKIIPLYRRLAQIAAILIGVISIYLISQLSSPMTVIEAPYGESLSLTLPDQSTVELNDGSSVSYDESGFTDERVLVLRGEATFEVTSGQSFQVRTDQGTVEVLGTQFNVRSWGNGYEVECYEGSVKVSSGSDQVVIEAQQSAVKTGDGLSIGSIDHTSPFWSEGLSKFDQEPIQLVLDEMERQFDVVIDYSGENKTFNGAFSHRDLDSALSAVCLPLGLTFQIDQEAATVFIR